MLDIAPLLPRDVPAALRLSTQAGWNQLPADWQRLLELFPQSCLGGRLDGQLLATATLAVYPAIASPRPAVGWVGMVLVDEASRDQGFGGAMMNAILALADRLNVPLVGLDATDLGRPVYLKKAFADAMPVDRWTGPARASLAGPAVPTSELAQSDWAPLLTLDAAATGIDRSSLLRRLASEQGATVRVLRDNSAVRGFAFRRTGRVAEYIGPVVSETPTDAQLLVESLLIDPSPPTQDQTLIDLPRATPLGELLSAAGFAISRRLTKMTRPETTGGFLSSPRLFAGAAFELA